MFDNIECPFDRAIAIGKAVDYYNVPLNCLNELKSWKWKPTQYLDHNGVKGFTAAEHTVLHSAGPRQRRILLARARARIIARLRGIPHRDVVNGKITR